MSSYDRLEEKGEALKRKYEEEALFKEKNKEEFRVIEEVFDRLTIEGVIKLFNRRVIDELHGVVKAGKEARIYWATDQEGDELAVKVYYTHTADFRRGMIQYIEGDPRFKRVRRNPRSIVYTWTQKEFSNLKLVEEAGVNAPRPIDFYRNILVMTFIGVDGVPAPLLREVEVQDPEDFYHILLEQIRLMYIEAGLVHGDLSEYNIMVWEEEPVIFDVSQAMLTSHHLADTLLQRDIRNVNVYFRRKGVDVFEPEYMEELIKGEPENRT